MTMNLRDNFLKGMLTGAGGVIIKIALNLLLIPVLIRYLGTNDYGFYLVLLNFSELLLALDAGLTTGLIHRLSHYLSLQDSGKVAEQLRIGQWLYGLLAVLVAVIGIALRPWLIGVFNLEAQHLSLAPMAFLIVFVDGALNLYSCYFQSILKAHCLYQWTNARDALQNILSNAISVLLVMMGFGLIEVLLARTAVTLVMLVNLMIRSIQVEPGTLQARWGITRAGLQDLFGVSVFAMIRNLSVFLAHRSDNFVVAAFLTVGEVGVLGVIARTFGQIGVFCTKIIEGIFPVFRRMATLDEAEKSRFVFVRLSAFMHFLATTLLLMAWANYETIFNFLASGKIPLGPTIPIAIIISVTIWSTAMQTPAANFLFAAGKHRFQTFSALVTALCNFGISIVLVKKIGLMGVVLGTLIPHVTQHQLVTVVMACRQLQVRFTEYVVPVYVKNLPSILGMLAVLLGARAFLGWVSPPAFWMLAASMTAALVGTVLWLFTATSAYERDILSRKFLARFPMLSPKQPQEKVSY